ncbi:MAG: ferrous iron transport protein A [Deltaproteobacteria bacterium]|nr:ferrous iron transport protein A [Deltaproteobacteria bacterium]
MDMEENIKLLEIGDRARITRIDGPGLRERLAGIGIREGLTVERLAPPPSSGCTEIRIGRRKVTLGLGVSMKVRVDLSGRSAGLAEMNPGDRAPVSNIQGGWKIHEILKTHFGIEPGRVIQMVGSRPDRDFLVEIGARRSSICEGDASKILVTRGRRIQLNYLDAGEEARVSAIAAGSSARSMLRELGIEEGVVIRIVEVTPSGYEKPEAPLLIRAGDKELAIGSGMAEKIWVEARRG